MSEDLFKGYGVEVVLETPEDYHVIQETLSRIGFAAKDANILFQSCHIFHKQGKYAIMHFKEMLAFDGKTADISENDLARRNKIVELLDQWELLDSYDKTKTELSCSMNQIKIVKYSDKNNWEFKTKYTFGRS